MNDEDSVSVIQFPKQNVRLLNAPSLPPETEEEMDYYKVKTKKSYIEYVLSEVWPMAAQMMEMHGFDVGHSDFIKTKSMAMDSLRALLHKCYGLRHVLTDAAEDIYIIETTSQNGNMIFKTQYNPEHESYLRTYPPKEATSNT